MILRSILLGSLALVLVQCAGSSKDEGMAAAESAKPRSMNERFNSRAKQGYYQDSEGNWKVRNDQRSSFESMGRSSMANQQYSGKTYQTGDVQKQSWWGDNRYPTQSYAGNTSADQWKTSAAGVDQSARESSTRSIFSRNKAATNTLERSSALENSKSSGYNGRSGARESQNAYDQPDIIDWKQQRSLELKDTKSWLRK